VAVAPTIHPSCLLQILFDVRWLRSADLDLLAFKACQEIVTYNQATTAAPRSVSFIFQVIS
jgi:hypothetical protein